MGEPRLGRRGPLPYLFGGAIVGLVLSLSFSLAKFDVSMWMFVLLCIFFGAAVWMIQPGGSNSPRVLWRRPEPPQQLVRSKADLATRRTATMIADASPDKGFTASALARNIARHTRWRLVRRGLPEEDTFDHADGILSKALLKYVRSAETAEPQTINQRTVRAYLKEIESL